jgi:hypothetical protein
MGWAFLFRAGDILRVQLLTPDSAKKTSRVGMLIITALLAVYSPQTLAQKTDLSAHVDALFTEWSAGTLGRRIPRHTQVLLTKGYGLANIEAKTPGSTVNIKNLRLIY